jgi:hypothetical protein
MMNRRATPQSGREESFDRVLFAVCPLDMAARRSKITRRKVISHFKL